MRKKPDERGPAASGPGSQGHASSQHGSSKPGSSKPGSSKHASSRHSALGPADVRRIAELARLRVDDAEIPALVDHFARMLRFVDSLAETDDPALPPWQLDEVRADALREDRARAPGEPGAPLPAEAWRANAPESDGPWFVVPRVVG